MRSFTAIITIVIGALMVREAKSQQHYVDRSGNYLTSVPNPYYAANGGMMRGATWAHIVEDGGREATAQETADWQAAQDAAALAAAEAAAQAEAEAEAQAALPQVFPTGIATLDGEGHHIELVPDMVDGVVVPVQISNSPLTVKDREAMKAAAVAVRAQAKAEKAALKAEVKDAKNDKAKLVAILKWIEAQ